MVLDKYLAFGYVGFVGAFWPAARSDAKSGKASVAATRWLLQSVSEVANADCQSRLTGVGTIHSEACLENGVVVQVVLKGCHITILPLFAVTVSTMHS